jgi:penicillin G amidase
VDVQFSFAEDGTPQATAANAACGYYALGFMHARHRPLQALLVRLAATGRLSETVFARQDLLALDALVHRLDLPGIGERESKHLDQRTTEWLDAYLSGFKQAIAEHGMPFELRAIGAKVALPDRASIVSGLLLSAYLGLAEGQERMERLILSAADAGADPSFLQALFNPHLDGAGDLRGFGVPSAPGFSSFPFATVGGSNAWAVTGSRSTSGNAVLAGDPHLQLNQLPALFLEVAMRVGNDYWLGATIPGLPGLALGRNRNVAWSGTFGVADNVDYCIEDIENEDAYVTREVSLGRRFKKPLVLRFFDTDRGTLETNKGRTLSTRWYGKHNVARALSAYMRLPFAKSTEDACRILDDARTLSLHYVVADKNGDVRHKHCGVIPKRAKSQLFPHGENAEPHADLPERRGEAIWSANEHLATISTFAQPPYRYDRIKEWLDATPKHDLDSFAQLQRDVRSLQAERLLPKLLPFIPQALQRSFSMWDFLYTTDSEGAHLFSHVYRAALTAFAPVLGGTFWKNALEGTEVSVWWAAALDAQLENPSTLPASWHKAFADELAKPFATKPWGRVQRVTLTHMVLGGVPGFDRGPYALPGSIATVSQGNVLKIGAATQVTAPAYRFLTDLGEDAAYTSLPGGIDGSVFSDSYDCWLDDYWSGKLHRLVPP